MTVREIIEQAIERLGLKKSLASRMQVSPSAVTRMLQRPEADQTIGQLQALADSTGLRWHYLLHDQAQFFHQLKAIQRRNISVNLTRFDDNEPSLTSPLAEQHLRHAMAEKFLPQEYILKTYNEDLKIVGWKLGSTSDRDEEVYDVYWIIYASRNWHSPFEISFNNMLYYNTDGGFHLAFVDHGKIRQSLRFPSEMGGIYRSLYTTLDIQKFGLFTELVRAYSDDGSLKSAQLIINDLAKHIDPVEQIHNTLNEISKTSTDQVMPTTNLRERIIELQMAYHLISEDNRYNDLHSLGFNISAGYTDDLVSQGFEDATKIAIIQTARRYRINPEWLLDGVTPKQERCEINGWHLNQIISEIAEHLKVQKIKAIYMIIEEKNISDNDGQPMIYARFAWAITHPNDPQFVVYDFTPFVRWNHVSIRLQIKAVCFFAEQAGLTVEGRETSSIEQGLLIPEILHHSKTHSFDIHNFMAATQGYEEIYAPSATYQESVVTFFETNGGPERLAEINATKI